MSTSEQPRFPGAEIVDAGVRDLQLGATTVESEAVLMAAGRLREAGVDVPPGPESDAPASHRLYALLAAEDSRGAHSRFNAIARRIVSFAQAAEHARSR